MFERYTERARRVIFFARYEASQFGSTTIETEHFLLGLIREDKNLTNRFRRNASSIESIRSEIEGRTTIREKVSTSTDLPLTDECKRILQYASEEAERLNHRHIGTEHLLLGILREDQCMAATILTERGLRLSTIREELARSMSGSDEPGVSLRSFRNTPPLRHPFEKDLMVPDALIAGTIATAIWTPVYGAEYVARQNPLQADLKMNVWFVTGSENQKGEEAPLFAVIQRMDGRVLSMGQKEKGKASGV